MAYAASFGSVNASWLPRRYTCWLQASNICSSRTLGMSQLQVVLVINDTIISRLGYPKMPSPSQEEVDDMPNRWSSSLFTSICLVLAQNKRRWTTSPYSPCSRDAGSINSELLSTAVRLFHHPAREITIGSKAPGYCKSRLPLSVLYMK